MLSCVKYERFYMEVNAETVKEVKKLLRGAYKSYRGSYGNITAAKAGRFLAELLSILYKYVPLFLSSSMYYEAFDIVTVAFVAIARDDIDDSNGEIYEMGEVAKDYWKRIISLSDLKTQKKMFSLLGKIEASEKTHFYVREIVEEFRNTGFRDLFFVKQLYDAEMEIIKAGHSDNWSAECRYRRAIANIAIYLGNGMGTEEEVDEYLKKHGKNEEVAENILEHYVDVGLNEKAIALMKKLLSMYGPNDHHKKSDLVLRCFNLLESLDRKSEALEFLKSEVVAKQNADDISTFLLIKERVSELEWESLRESIYWNYESPFLAKTADTCLSLELMFSEGDVDRCFDSIQARNFSEYGNQQLFKAMNRRLKKLNPERTMKLHLHILDMKMKPTKNRNYYRWVIGDLSRIRKQYNEPMLTQKLADSWKEKYSNRSAMMEELEIAGF